MAKGCMLEKVHPYAYKLTRCKHLLPAIQIYDTCLSTLAIRLVTGLYGQDGGMVQAINHGC